MRDQVWFGRLVIFVMSGLVFGVLTGLQDSSLKGGVFGGLAFGVFFSAIVAVSAARRNRPIRNLSKADRHRVILLVNKGEAVTDPRLAPAVLEYAAIVRRVEGKPQTTRLMTAVFITLGVVILLGALASDHPTAIAADAILVVVWCFNWFWLPKQRDKRLERVAPAETRARQLLANP